jgi:hypothetical protein
MKPKFTRINRNGKAALFADLDNHSVCICEIPNKELTNEVQKAIISAYYKGAFQQRALILSSTGLEGELRNQFVTE